MLLTYYLNDFEIVPVTPIITGITFDFYIPHALYFYCKIFIFFNILGFFFLLLLFLKNYVHAVAYN